MPTVPIFRRVLLLVALTLAMIAYCNPTHRARADDEGGGATAVTPVRMSSAESQRAYALYTKICAGCHGEQLQGVVGPALMEIRLRYSLAEIEQIAQQGKGRNRPISMPAGLTSPDEARLLARWLAAGPQLARDALH
jgi:cytochrome c551